MRLWSLDRASLAARVGWRPVHPRANRRHTGAGKMDNRWPGPDTVGWRAGQAELERLGERKQPVRWPATNRRVEDNAPTADPLPIHRLLRPAGWQRCLLGRPPHLRMVKLERLVGYLLPWSA